MLLLFVRSAGLRGCQFARPLSVKRACVGDLPWKPYLVEFRALLPHFRLPELHDALSFVMMKGEHAHSGLIDDAIANHVPVVPDIRSDHPICAYVCLPADEEVLKEVAGRCALVRRVVEVWGDGADAASAAEEVRCYAGPLLPFPSDGSWRVQFSRYGRAGPDMEERMRILEAYADTLSGLPGDVRLTGAQHTLVHYEHHEPQRALLGREVCRGAAIAKFNLSARPFLSTTSLEHTVAHLTAAAALAGPGDLVLDPFAGSGSLLVAAAALGAEVLGSDIDPACSTSSGVQSRFRRTSGLLTTQAGLTAADNFAFYGTAHLLVSLQQRDAASYLTASTPEEVDGIVADPPFGCRERIALPALPADERRTRRCAELIAPSEVQRLGDPSPATALLLRIAALRLRPGRRLCFWLPSDEGKGVQQVTSFLDEVERAALGEEVRQRPLRLLRVTPEQLPAGMWRWLVVYEKTTKRSQ